MSRDYAAEAVELWEQNGLTVEFLEGMSYNHRVALIGTARKYLALVASGDVRGVLDLMGAEYTENRVIEKRLDNLAPGIYGVRPGKYLVVRVEGNTE